MSEDKHEPTLGVEPPVGVAADDLSQRLAELLLGRDIAALSELDDVDLDQLQDALTPEDLAGLASLGSSAALIAEVTAAAERKPKTAGKQVELRTQSESRETVAVAGSKFAAGASTPESCAASKGVKVFDEQDQIVFHGCYRKVTELGRGGQGVVYRVEEADEFAATYALKVFHPRHDESEADFATDMARMQQAASLIHRSHNDDVVDVHWFGQRDEAFTMLMQFIDGFDLRRLLQPELLEAIHECVGSERWSDITNVVYAENGTPQLALKPAIAVYICERILRGLAALHERGLVHGDIKPSNIMLAASGSVKIIDVGSAFQADSPPKWHHFTPVYAAPEFHETGTMSQQSDLASVGYMLIELLTGKPIIDNVADPDQSTRSVATSTSRELLEAKLALPDLLRDMLPKKAGESEHLVKLCQCLIDPDLNRRFLTTADSIVSSRGTFEFSKDLTFAGLAVCTYHEVTRWLADVNQTRQSLPGVE